MRHRLLWVALLVAIAVGHGALAVAQTGSVGLPEGVDHRFVVPDGTAATLDSGGVVEILPRDLEVRVGDRIVVVNDDTRAHAVGPWTVRALDTFTFRFRAVGRYDSHCSLHGGGGRFFIDVLPGLA
jgi:plastocyanin